VRQYANKEVIQRVTEKVVCDICKNEIKNQPFDSSEVKIEARIGNYFPEADSRKYYRIDCCKYCFESIKDTIEEKYGVKFTEGYSSDYDKNGDEID
jgi:hypothetical protein